MHDSFITRPLDNNGRIVIPMEIRRKLRIMPDDLLEISEKNGVITLTKHVPGCIFCSSSEDTVYFQGKAICNQCLKAMHEAF